VLLFVDGTLLDLFHVSDVFLYVIACCCQYVFFDVIADVKFIVHVKLLPLGHCASTLAVQKRVSEEPKFPEIKTAIPGPKSKELIGQLGTIQVSVSYIRYRD